VPVPRGTGTSFARDTNIRYLEKIAQEIKEGKAHFAEHDLIEVD
jgi:DNA-damage-inducible protein J